MNVSEVLWAVAVSFGDASSFHIFLFADDITSLRGALDWYDVFVLYKLTSHFSARAVRPCCFGSVTCRLDLMNIWSECRTYFGQSATRFTHDTLYSITPALPVGSVCIWYQVLWQFSSIRMVLNYRWSGLFPSWSRLSTLSKGINIITMSIVNIAISRFVWSTVEH